MCTYVLVADVHDAVDVVEAVPLLIGPDRTGHHDLPVEGDDDLIGESAVVQSVEVDESDSRQQLIPFGHSPARLTTDQTACEVDQGAAPAADVVDFHHLVVVVERGPVVVAAGRVEEVLGGNLADGGKMQFSRIQSPFAQKMKEYFFYIFVQ